MVQGAGELVLQFPEECRGLLRSANGSADLHHVGEVADGPFEAARGPAGRRYAGENVLLTCVAIEQDVEHAKEEYRSVDAERSGTLSGRPAGLGRQHGLEALAIEGMPRFRKAIGGDFEDGQVSRQLAAPVPQVRLSLRGLQVVALPGDEVSEVGWHLRLLGCGARCETLVGFPKCLREEDRGDTVEDNMVHHDEHCIFGRMQ